MEACLTLVRIDLIDDHPKNPRVVMRQDVIDGIAANMNGEYPKQHAMRVRPVGDRYELISGHHRKQAAIKKGFNAVWCWVEELDDDEAFMQLVTSNNQGELDPLEIGIHAFEAVPVGKRGRGNIGGGNQEYAKRIGKSAGFVSQMRAAGEVVCKVKLFTQVNNFIGKARHVYEISRLPEECWQSACEWLSSSADSLAEVKARVDNAMESKAIAKLEWLISRDNVIQKSFMAGRDLTRDYERLADIIVETKSRLGDELSKSFIDWLKENASDLDVRKVQAKRIELEQKQWEIDNPPVDEPEPQLVSVLLADPPWQYDFAETDSRQIENQYPTADADEIATHLQLPWAPKLANDCVLFMWATAPKLREAFTVLDGWGFEYKTHAVWDKEKIGMGYWFRGQHELLIVATRGKKSPPEPANRFPSMFREVRDSKHSRKPVCVYEAIEQMFPDDVKFEMYSREPRQGWLAGGNDANRAI